MKKRWLKRGLAVFLTAATVLGLGIYSGGNPNILTVQAAGRSVAITSCLINGENVQVQTSSNGLPQGSDGKLYLFADEVCQDGTVGDIVAETSAAPNATFTFPLNLNAAGSNLTRKFLVAVKSGNGYTQVSDEHYITNPEAVASHTAARMQPASIKGILPDQTNALTSSLTDLGVKQVVYNMYMDYLVGPSTDPSYPTINYSYDGENYEFNGYMVASYQNMVRIWNKQGIQVTMALILRDAPNVQALMHPNAKDGFKCPGYAFNTEEEAAVKQYKAIASFIGSHFSSPKDGQVDNWIVGNEVNARASWYYQSDTSMEKCVNDYAKAFRIFYNGIKSENGSARIYNSIDQEWRTTSGPGCFRSKDYLDRFNYYITREGNIDWGVSIHPYNAPLFDLYAWQGQDVYVNDDMSTPYMTMQTFHVFVDYMKQPQFLSPDGQVRSISIAEIGYTSDLQHGEDNQYASIAYSYLMAASFPEVDSYMLFRETDAPDEMDDHLWLGLKHEDGSHKPSYDLYKYIDTPQAGPYLDRASQIIGMDVTQMVNTRTYWTRNGFLLPKDQ